MRIFKDNLLILYIYIYWYSVWYSMMTNHTAFIVTKCVISRVYYDINKICSVCYSTTENHTALIVTQGHSELGVSNLGQHKVNQGHVTIGSVMVVKISGALTVVEFTLTTLKYVYLIIYYYYFLFSFWPILIFKTDTNIYTLCHYNIIYSIGRAALEQAYRSLCKLDSN